MIDKTYNGEAILRLAPERVLEVVMTAIDWLEANPDRWTRGIYARRADTSHVEPHSPEAHCFCTLGRIALEADVFVHQLGVFLIPLDIDQSVVVELNDVDHPDPNEIREYFNSQYAKMKERQP